MRLAREGFSAPLAVLRGRILAARPLFYSLALLAVAVGFASAQNPTNETCSNSFASNAPVRAEGQTEQVADETFTCSGPGSVSAASFYFTYNLPITSQILQASTGFSEATLVVAGGASYPGVVTGNQIQFSNVTLPSGTVNFTVTNVRVNASTALDPQVNASGLLSYIVATTAGFTTANASIPSASVAFVLPSLAPTGESASYAACGTVAPSTGPVLLLRVSELFLAAFKTQGGVGNSTLGSEFTANTETGYFTTIDGISNQANSGTRIRVLFSGVPSGAIVYVPVSVTNNGATLSLTSSESGPFSPVTPIVPNSGNGIPSGLLLGQVAITAGSGEAVYEVTAQNPTAFDSFTIPVYLGASASSVAGSTITATVGYAPVAATATGPVAPGGVPLFIATVASTFTTTPITSCLPLTISNTTLAPGEQSYPYFQGLAASGVATWGIASGSSLPSGLTLDPATGVISGTPTVSGSFNFTVQLTDSSNNTVTQTLALQIDPPVSVATTSLPSGQVGAQYYAALSANGGIGPFTWQVVQGQSPVYLDSSTGQLSSIPEIVGTSVFTVQVTDSLGARATSVLSIQIAPAPCTVSGTQINIPLRVEGTTERLSDLSFTCMGNPSATFTIRANGGPFAVALPLTSKILNTTSRVTEAALITNGTTTLGTLDPTGQIITFSDVPVMTGSPITITDVRVNASAADTIPSQVEETIGGYGSGVNSIEAGLEVTTLGAPTLIGLTNYPACSAISVSSGPAFTVKVNELVGGSFLIQQSASDSTLGQAFNTETGFLVSSGGVSNVANSGTRIRLLFGNVPAGVTVYVPVTVTGANGDTFTLTTTEAGPFSAVAAVTIPGATGLAPVTISAGSGEAVYEFTAAGTLAGLQSYPVPVYLASTGPVVAGQPMTVAVSYAPIGASSNIPNFVVETPAGNPIFASAFNFCLQTILPGGQVGQPYGPVAVAVSGGTAPYTFTPTFLPPGLTISSGGIVSGAPTQAGATFVSATITDANGITEGFSLPVQIQETNPLTITTLALPNGYQTVAYNQSLQASGGTTPYIWTISSGSLSATGLTLSSSGAITGTPTTTGTFPLTVRVTDALGVAVTQNLTLNLYSSTPAITQVTGPLPGLTGLAPGGIATITGTGLSFGGFAVESTPTWPTTLNNTAVIVNGIPAPIHNVSDTAIGFQIPYEVAVGTAYVQVGNGIASSTGFSVNVAVTAPAIAVALPPLNQIYDQDGTLNSASNPAATGSEVEVFVTGLGQVIPSVPDGSTAATVSAPLAPVSALVDGVPAAILFAGLAPGLGVGEAQVNFLVPPLTTGQHSLAIAAAGNASNTVNFYISNAGPVTPPLITSVTPSTATPGAPSTPITVAGQNFISGSTLTWTAPNGSQTSIMPSLVQAAQIAATIPAALLSTSGTAQIAITDPSGLQSNSAAFTITAPNFTTSISPAQSATSTSPLTLTLSGPSYSGSPTVTFTSSGGQSTAVTPTQVQPQQITVAIPAALLGTPGDYFVGVTGSNQLRLKLRTSIGSLNPSSVPYGSSDTAVSIVTSSPVANGSTAQFTGPTGITANFALSAQLAATIPAAYLTTPGTAQIAIGDPGGTHSNSLPFSITSPLSVTSLAPSTALAGSGATTLAVTTATAPTAGTTVTWTDAFGNLTNLGGTIGSSGITATIPASLLMNAGAARVGIVDGSGVLSNQLPFQIQPFLISSVAPNSASSQSTATQVTIAGANLNGAVSVAWTTPDGKSVQFSPDLIQAAQVAATIPAALLTTPGTAQLALSDAFGNPSNTLPFTINALPALTIQTTSIAPAVMGQAYTAMFSATGGNPIGPYTWSIASVATPAFISMSATGVLSATAAAAAGSYPLVIQVEDLSGTIASVPITLTVAGPLSITSAPTLPIGVVGIPYSTALTATGGVAANYMWTATGLPPWLTLATNGQLSGTPPSTAPVSFTAQVTDGIQTATQAFTIPINATLTIVSPPIHAAWINQAYSPLTFTAPGGTSPFTWSIGAGTLPAGLTLDPVAGTLSGTPTTAGVANFTVKVVDSTAPGITATLPVTLVVAQQYVLSTIAGNGPPLTQPAVGSPAFSYTGISVDTSGNVYFAAGNSVYKVDQSGNQTLVAGNGKPGYSGDGGPAASAQLNGPAGTAVDNAGNLYIADLFNARIRKVSPGGVITTLAGTGYAGYTGDGGAAQLAQLAEPTGVAVDALGNVYVADTLNNAVRRVSPSGVITTFAAGFSQPSGVAVDTSGHVFVADSRNNAVKIISPSGVVTTIAGTGTQGDSGDGGPPAAAQLNFPLAVAVDNAGNIYVAEPDNSAVRKIASNTITTVVTFANGADGVAVDSSGALYYSRLTTNQGVALSYEVLNKLAGGSTSAVAGGALSTQPLDEGGPATAALLSVYSIATDQAGNVYAGAGDGRVRRISQGIITTVAGNGQLGFAGDGGSALSAELGGIETALAFDRSGDLFIGDSNNYRVREVNTSGIVSTVAGSGAIGSAGDGGPALNAAFSLIEGLAVDPQSDLFIADQDTNRVREAANTGIIATVAGNGQAGFTPATLNQPGALALDTQGNLYIADTGNFAVRRLSGGTLATVAGTGSYGSSQDGGLAVNTALDGANGVLIDNAGNLLVDGARRVRLVSPLGVISTVAGGVNMPFSNDGVVNNGDGGPATSGDFYDAGGMTQDPSGNVFIADDTAIRRLTPSSAAPLAITTPSLPGVSVNTAYPATTIAASGGTPGYTWSATALPPGLTLDPASGTVSGTPTAQGIFDFTVTLTDSGTVATTGVPAQVAARNFRVQITGPPFITTTSLPAGIANIQYQSIPVIAGGGTPGYTWSVSSGNLPSGLTLNPSTGLISGTPTGGGSFTFTIQIADSGTPALTATQSFTLMVSPPLSIQTTSIPGGVAGKAYTTTFSALGGNTSAPYMWSIASTGTPSFLSLSASGVLSTTTASVVGSYPLTIQVQDAGGTIAIGQFTFVVSPVLTITSTSPLPTAVATVPYSQTLTATGGFPASYAWSASVLPGWATLSASGILSGTPPAAGSVSFTAQLTDGVQTTSQLFTFAVNAALTIQTTSIPAIAVGRPYSTTLAATGGISPYKNWTVSSGSLPTGLTLASATGVLSGTIASGTGAPFNFSVTVQDNAGNTSAAQNFSLAVLPPTTTTLSIPGTSAVFAQPVTLTAMVSPSSATGKVTFYDSTTILGIATLAAGKATLTTGLQTVGSRSLTAFYSGDANNAPSLSNLAPQKVATTVAAGFSAATNYPAGASIIVFASADFNRDGASDLIATDGTGLTFLPGKGDGSFGAPQAIPLAGNLFDAIATTDFNGDGVPDLAVVNGTTSIAILLGKGDGTFTQAGLLSAGTAMLGTLVSGDFNNDGLVDLAALDTIDSTVTIFIGNGDGTFHSGSVVSLSSPNSSAMQVADFNNDGKADLAVSNLIGAISILLGNGDGTFGKSVSYPAGLSSTSIAIGDFNGDGNPDIASASPNDDGVNVLLGKGDGTFNASVLYSIGEPVPIAVVAGDFNGNGFYDVAATTAGLGAVVVLPGKGDGTLQQPVVYPSNADSPILMADLNGDGRPDLITRSNDDHNIRVLLGLQPLTVTTTSLPAGTQNTAYTTSTIAVTGGSAPYTFSLSSGSLPSGLALNPSTGTIGGTPVGSGSSTFTVQVTDSSPNQLTATQAYTVVISPAPNNGGGGGGTPPPPVTTSALIGVSPTSLSFSASPSSITGSMPIKLSDTASFVGFTATATTSSGGNWLSVSPASGDVGTNLAQPTLTVSYNATGLSKGTYTGTVTVSDGSTTASVAVTLQVSGQITVSPSSISFSYTLGDTNTPAPQSISVFSTPTGLPYTVSFTGGAWLSVTAPTGSTAPGTIAVSVLTQFLIAGTLKGSVTITPAIGAPVDVPVTIAVKSAAPPMLSVSPPLSTFALTQGSAAVLGQATVSNTGGGTLQFTAQASTDACFQCVATWLKINGSGPGSATSSLPAVVSYTVDPSGLSPGVYAGRITITDSNGNQGVSAVSLVLGQAAQSILLSQSGLTFNAVAGGNVASTQSFSVLNTGGGTMNWTAAATTVSVGNWLSVSPSSGSSIGGQAGAAGTVSANPAGMSAGQYYGTVTIAAPGANNSPESVAVLMIVAQNGGGADVTLSTGAVILVGPAGSTPERSGQITLFNPAASSLNFSVTASTSGGGNWLSVNPAGGSLTPGNTSLTVTGDFSQLPAGVQTGTVRVAFDDGTVDTVTVDAIATGGVASSDRNGVTVSALHPLATGACVGGKASYLITAIAAPLGQSTVQAAMAQSLRVLIVDDCGNPVTTGGAAQVSFTNASGSSDAPISLQDAGGGLWEGTWIPVNTGSVAVTVVAADNSASGTLASATASVSVTVAAASANAAAQASGVVNAASSALATPGVVAPGSIVAIYGSGLASSTAQASSVPLLTTLGGTQVLLGNQPLPLFYAATGQINGLIPQNLNPDASYQLTISRGNTISVPTPITVVQYQPGVFTMDFSGSGQGAVEIAGTSIVAAPVGNGTRPVQSGSEYLSIFATGLGPVTGPNGEAPPPDGAAAPSNLLYSTTATATVTIGGMNVPVQFSGLTPGTVGLYQVNVQVPAGTPTGNAVPVVVTLTDPATGSTYVANTVTVAVQ